VTTRQVEELKAVEPWSRENGVTAFARRHGMTIPSVYHWRRKLGLPVAKWCGRMLEPRQPAEPCADRGVEPPLKDEPAVEVEVQPAANAASAALALPSADGSRAQKPPAVRG
jgi:hypothetical protein